MSAISVAVEVSERSYDAVLRSHQHAFHQILFPDQGRMTLQVGQEPGWVGGGRMAFVPAGIEHAYWSDVPNRVLVADLDIGLADEASSSAWSDAGPSPFLPLDARLIAVAAALRSELHSDGLADPLVADALGRYLMSALRRAEGDVPPAVSPSARRLASAAEEYLRTHFARPLSVSEVAAAVGASTAHLHRSFRAVTGTSLLSYVQLLRLEQAATLLIATDLTILEIAHAVGFASQSHLSRLFTRHFCMSAGRYRATMAGSDTLLQRSGKTAPRPVR